MQRRKCRRFRRCTEPPFFSTRQAPRTIAMILAASSVAAFC